MPDVGRNWIIAATGLFLVGCAGKDPPSESAPPAAEVAGAMCAEHGVLEAVCTKCNPKLIPVFQAKGDWCDEHGFPESFCPICHPERGGKPVADVAADDAPPDGTKIRFKTKETARLAGIQDAKAETRPGGARLAALASIKYDATRHAEINARSAGVIRELKVDVGATVKRGAVLAVVESAEVGANRSQLRAAAARVRIAEQNYSREQQLHAQGITSATELSVAEQALEEARADRSASASAVGVVGGAGGASSYAVTAPIAGTVIQRAATIGHMVDLEQVLFEIVDTSAMWAEIEIAETDLGLVKPGQQVTLTVDGIADRTFSGSIEYVAPEIEPQTRTARARVGISNPDGALRANMFARAEIALGEARSAVSLPRSAVQRAGGIDLCFVKLDEDQYETRRIAIGIVEGDRVEVLEGVKAGEVVAAEGSFLLKTETLKGSIGAGCCDVE